MMLVSIVILEYIVVGVLCSHFKRDETLSVQILSQLYTHLELVFPLLGNKVAFDQSSLGTVSDEFLRFYFDCPTSLYFIPNFGWL